MSETKTLAVPVGTHQLVHLAAASQHKKIGEMAETLIRIGLERLAPEVIELAHNGLSDFTQEGFSERMISEQDSFAAEPLLLRD